MTTEAPLAMDEAVLLAHALAAAVAEHHGVRYLFIKGPVVATHGLRAARTSSDVDVWVDPAGLQDMVDALLANGWVLRPAPEGPRIISSHSTSLMHPRWPCDIDVHRSYPGFLAPEQEVFEYVWREHTTELVLAGRPVVAADRMLSAAVLTLHALRDMHLPRHRSELDQVIHILDGALDPQERQSLMALARHTWADETLAPLFRRLDIPVGAPAGPPEEYGDALQAWRIRCSDNSPTSQWLTEIRRATPMGRLKVLVRALVLPGDDLTKTHPEFEGGAAGRLELRVRRIGRGVRDFPSAVRTALRVRGW